MVPEITPVAGAMARPSGRPDADQVRGSPSGSVAGVGSDTAAPSASPRSPRSPSKAGARLVSMTIQVKVSVADRPPGSATRTSTAYGEPAAAS